jgi:competence protein ComEC
LGLGYLTGQRTALPPEIDKQVKIVGLTHVVVASGYNLTILVLFSRRLFSRVSKYFATLMSGLLIMSFMMVTGLSPSMTRAGLVAGLGLLVWYYGRRMHPFVLLSFAAALTLLYDPSYAWGDLGWYLSFGSFIGVIVLAPLLQDYFWGSDKIPLLRQLFIDTLSAQILTMPLILLSFGQYSLYAIPANMLVLPFVPLAMLCTFVAGIGGLVAPGVAELAGYPATLILKYSIAVIERVAGLPDAQKELTFNPQLMIASYLVIGAAITYLIRRTNHDFRNGSNENFS